MRCARIVAFTNMFVFNLWRCLRNQPTNPRCRQGYPLSLHWDATFLCSQRDAELLSRCNASHMQAFLCELTVIEYHLAYICTSSAGTDCQANETPTLLPQQSRLTSSGGFVEVKSSIAFLPLALYPFPFLSLCFPPTTHPFTCKVAVSVSKGGEAY